MVMMETREESLIREIKSFVTGGMTVLMAWGMTTW